MSTKDSDPRVISADTREEVLAERASSTDDAAAVIGYIGTAGVLVFGLIRALSDAAEIIR